MFLETGVTFLKIRRNPLSVLAIDILSKHTWRRVGPANLVKTNFFTYFFIGIGKILRSLSLYFENLGKPFFKEDLAVATSNLLNFCIQTFQIQDFTNWKADIHYLLELPSYS